MSGRIDVDAIRSAVAISEVIGRYVELRKAGAEFKGLCPFHEERTPSFSVNDAKGIFRCFGCNAGGDVIDATSGRDDTITCGGGADRVRADATDTVASDCEQVTLAEPIPSALTPSR